MAISARLLIEDDEGKVATQGTRFASKPAAGEIIIINHEPYEVLAIGHKWATNPSSGDFLGAYVPVIRVKQTAHAVAYNAMLTKGDS